MNVFGGATGSMMDKGPRGPRGVKGTDSSLVDFCTWLPHSVLNILQSNDEKGAFFIDNLDRDIVRPKGKGTAITEWVSRSRRGGNLVAKKASSEIEEIETAEWTVRYAMKFKTTTHYEATGSPFLLAGQNSCGFICITFRTNSVAEQVLICGPDPSRRQPPTIETEIKVSGATEIIIQINDVKEIIQHACRKWTTLFVEYNSDAHLSHFTYDVNGTIGSFTSPSMAMGVYGFHLGCRWNGTNYLDGEIASVETYAKSGTSAPLPDTLKSIVMHNQKVHNPF